MRFYFEPPGQQRVKLAWGHGRYLDPWSIVHTLSGLMTGIALTGFKLPLWLGILTILVVALLYEVLEMALGIIENVENVIADIILAILGVRAAYWLVGGWDVKVLALAFSIIATLNLGLVYLGWRNHLRGLFQGRSNGVQDPLHPRPLSKEDQKS